jgi:ATP-dependent RNA helicase DDX35
LTDGLLLREMMIDPLLLKYSVVMLDEAHERAIHNDILFILFKKVMKKRSGIRIIVSSATLDAETFCDFFEVTEKVMLLLKLRLLRIHHICSFS